MRPSPSDSPFEFDGVAFIARGPLTGGIVKFRMWVTGRRSYKVKVLSAIEHEMFTADTSIELIDCPSMSKCLHRLKSMLEDIDITVELGDRAVASSLNYDTLYSTTGAHSISFDPDLAMDHDELLGLAREAAYNQ